MKLLESFRMGSLMLKNRMVMAAMTRSRADIHGVVGTMTAEYYAQRASAGLILSEAINISANALGSPLTPGLFEEKQVAAWRKVTQAVHEKGGIIFRPALAHWPRGPFRGSRRPIARGAFGRQNRRRAAFHLARHEGL